MFSFTVVFEYTKNGTLVANISNSRGDFDGKVRASIPFLMLIFRMKNVCLSVMAKLKSENPEFNLDFESFVQELSSDEPVCPCLPCYRHLWRLELMLMNSVLIACLKS